MSRSDERLKSTLLKIPSYPGVLIRALATTMKKDPPTSLRKETISCPACLALNNRSAAFCHKCGYPIGEVATLDPMQTIQAEGHLFRKAIEGRPKPIVVIGVWLCFLPSLVAGVYSAIRLILNPTGFSGFFFFWVMVALSYAAFVILYRTTKNYLTIPEKTWRETTENRSDAEGKSSQISLAN